MTPTEVYDRLGALLSAHGIFVTPGIFGQIDYATRDWSLVATRAPNPQEEVHISYRVTFE